MVRHGHIRSGNRTVKSHLGTRRACPLATLLEPYASPWLSNTPHCPATPYSTWLLQTINGRLFAPSLVMRSQIEPSVPDFKEHVGLFVSPHPPVAVARIRWRLAGGRYGYRSDRKACLHHRSTPPGVCGPSQRTPHVHRLARRRRCREIHRSGLRTRSASRSPYHRLQGAWQEVHQ